MEKWAIVEPDDQTILVPYHEFVARPKEQLQRIAEFVGPGESFIPEKYDWVLKIQEIAQRKDLFDFRYATRQWVHNVEQQLSDYLDQCRIPRIASVD